MFEALKNRNKRLINEAIENKTHTTNWEKNFRQKQNEELYQSHWYRTISYNLCQKNLHLGNYEAVIDLGEETLQNIEQTNDYFKDILIFVKEAKSKLHGR